MPEDKKKNPSNHNGNKVIQGDGDEFKFVKDYKTWRTHCQGIGSGALQVKHIPNLYVMLKNHMKGNIRSGSRNNNPSLDGQGAIQFLDVIDSFIDSADLFTNAQAFLIKNMAKTLAAMKDTGKDAGGSSPAFDPAFILFTEGRTAGTGQRRKGKTVQGHYATEEYAKNNEGVTAVPADWLAGNNPPHQALFSETKTQFANPKGLLYIMQDAMELLDDLEITAEVDRIPEGVDAVDIDEIDSVEKFFGEVIKNAAYWSNGGKLLVNKVRAQLQSTDFPVKPSEQGPVREITNLGKKDEKDAIAGTVTSFRLTSTATPIINLVDRALKRANTNKAPNGYRAWQNTTKRGFDYRKTRREKFGEEAQGNLDNKVISKMWQQLLWRN